MMTVKVHEFVNAILINEITITQWLCLYPSDPSKTVSNMIESKTLRTLYDSIHVYIAVILYVKIFVRQSFMNHHLKLLLVFKKSKFVESSKNTEYIKIEHDDHMED